jgi:NAD(P)H-hydrate epimerase
MELEPLYTAAEMRDTESRAIEGLGLPAAVLMERAGMAAAGEIARRFPGAQAATILCGAGNNGGDGFVVARHLHSAGWAVEVFLTGVAGKLKDDAKVNFQVARNLGVPVHERVAPARLKRGVRRADVVVDALLGTGFSGTPRPGAAALIDAIDAAGGAVASLDVPSGIDSSTGQVGGEAVNADLTISFHGAKVGLKVSPGRRYAGHLAVVPIGIPPQIHEPTAVGLATHDVLDLVPRKDAASTKYSAGAVLVIGGAPGFTGAPALSARAALRAGAGIAWIAAPAEVAGVIARSQDEIMVHALPEALELCDRAGAIAIGPGLGRDADVLERTAGLALGLRVPIVLDADGLHAFAGELTALARRRAGTVLTPHEGEMASLLGESSDWVRANRLEAVRRAAKQADAVVLLKGADTLVAQAGGEHVALVDVDTPGLATAGSGDVLTGVVAAFLAKGLDAWEAATCAAVTHASAGAHAAEMLGPMGIIAGDVIDALPSAFLPR